MLRLLRRVVNFFRRREDPAQEQRPLQAEHQQGNTRLKCIHGVVTSFYGDYGLISGSIYFSYDVVTGKVPVKIGQKVAVVVEEDAASHGLKAIKVDVLCDDTADSEPSDLGTRILTACVTSVRTDAVYISKKTCFSLDIVSEGYMPYKGDGLEVEYSLLPGTSKIKVHAVKPMNCKHVEKDKKGPQIPPSGHGLKQYPPNRSLLQAVLSY
ncbi:hypothetical protein TREES_T100015338 [Tupaia chinensis]|uniref:Uncharacterized protein n=1 Tax=Tupaia chinensis TaxID=246437 RepID=L8YCI3_TUPCH|nr:hypothetical protein TREES_T100015338 [Tupaia chinensis]